MRDLMTQIHSEKRVTGRYHHDADFTECITQAEMAWPTTVTACAVLSHGGCVGLFTPAAPQTHVSPDNWLFFL